MPGILEVTEHAANPNIDNVQKQRGQPTSSETGLRFGKQHACTSEHRRRRLNAADGTVRVPREQNWQTPISSPSHGQRRIKRQADGPLDGRTFDSCVLTSDQLQDGSIR